MAVCLALTAMSAAAARAVQGEIGARSRGSVVINVQVVPRVRLAPSVPGISPPAVQVLNGDTLRYSVIAAPAHASAAATPGKPEQSAGLLLVVPD